jgi:hypothetical protein
LVFLADKEVSDRVIAAKRGWQRESLLVGKAWRSGQRPRLQKPDLDRL